MSDIEEADKAFVSHVVGLYNMIKTVPSEGMGLVDFKTLSNVEYESVTYFSSELDKMRAHIGGR